MNVLGLSCYYHDAAATLLRDGRIVAAAEEERFTRKKHDNAFPALSIAYCLEEAGIRPLDLDAVCFYEKPFRKVERMLVSSARWSKNSNDYLQQQLSLAVHERLFLENVLRKEVGYEGPVLFMEHHLAHAASAYYLSGFEEAAVITVDGVGEWATTAQYIGRGSQLEEVREIHYPHSLGLLYSTITAFLGFKVNNDEYKVMGLASYGQPRLLDKIWELVKLYPDGSFELDLDYFSFMYDPDRMYSDRLVALLGPPRTPGDVITDHHKDLASSLQKAFEEVMITMGRAFHEACGGLENVCLAGGTALNCVSNGRFIQETPFKRIWVQPASGDSGGAMGAALYAYLALQGKKPESVEHSSLLGPSFSNGEIRRLLDDRGVSYQELDEQQLIQRTADLIWENMIVGWFQGRMEFGPRALGCRSILANPCNADMKDVLNSRVKFREDFRPFAPAVLKERAQEYFEIDFDSPYMLFATQVKPGMGQKIPAITHVDNSARVQTVDKRHNPRFYRLVEAFSKISGVPVVINTSFNIRGEPIVCTPEDALNCFMNTGIDFLVMGDFLVEKEV